MSVLALCLVDAILGAAMATAVPPATEESPIPHHGGGPLPKQSTPCVSAEDRARVARQIDEYEQRFGPVSQRPTWRVNPPLYPFFPMAGHLYADLYTVNFTDLDPGAGLLDWDCTDFTYDGHAGIDVAIRTFGEQEVGVPLFAVWDGVVLAMHDGEFDQNTTMAGQPANYVVIDHGGGRVCYYWHMKRWSVSVSAGQQVRAGEQVGLAGSSGNSTWPHLHFETHDYGTVVEPYAGPCRPGDSLWIEQTPIDRSFLLLDFNIFDPASTGTPDPPFDIARTGTFVLGTRQIGFWINPMNLPADATWRVRYRRPDDTVAFDSGVSAWNNSFYRWSWWWWYYSVSLESTGTWHVLFDVNGETLIEAPFEVVGSPGQIANRPPARDNHGFARSAVADPR